MTEIADFILAFRRTGEKYSDTARRLAGNRWDAVLERVAELSPYTDMELDGGTWNKALVEKALGQGTPLDAQVESRVVPAGGEFGPVAVPELSYVVGELAICQYCLKSNPGGPNGRDRTACWTPGCLFGAVSPTGQPGEASGGSLAARLQRQGAMLEPVPIPSYDESKESEQALMERVDAICGRPRGRRLVEAICAQGRPDSQGVTVETLRRMVEALDERDRFDASETTQRVAMALHMLGVELASLVQGRVSALAMEVTVGNRKAENVGAHIQGRTVPPRG